MNNNRKRIPQHEPLRVPRKWGPEERSFVIQLENILNDIYKHFLPLESKDFSDALLEELSERMNGGQ